MKKRRTRNTRLTSEKERQKQFIINSVVKRGRRFSWKSVSKWASRVAKVLLVAGVFGGVYWAATEGYRRLFWENPDYALKDVQFQTDGSMPREQAIATAGLNGGRNVFAYDLNVAREALLALPQVESAELRRYLPDRIDIAVTERQPVAWVSQSVPAENARPERGRLIDAKARVFQPKRTLPQQAALPCIVGAPLEDFAPGKPVHAAEVMMALELLRKVRESGAFQVTCIDVSKGYCLLVTDHKGVTTTFGLDDLDEQLKRLAVIREEAVRIGQDLKTVNVMVSRNIPVTFRPPPAPEPDLDELLREPGSKEVPKAKVVEPSGSKKSSPSRKSEPSKTKEAPARENEPLLRPFRRV
jgi:cell division septal protein FtsQ